MMDQQGVAGACLWVVSGAGTVLAAAAAAEVGDLHTSSHAADAASPVVEENVEH